MKIAIGIPSDVVRASGANLVERAGRAELISHAAPADVGRAPSLADGGALMREPRGCGLVRCAGMYQDESL